MGMNLSLKVRHPKCVNNYVYMLLPQKSAAKVQKNLLSRKFILQKITSTPKFNTDKKRECVRILTHSRIWRFDRWNYFLPRIRLERLLLISAFASNDYFLSHTTARTITSPSRQIPLDHIHYPRSRRAMVPTIERRMGSCVPLYPIAMDERSSLQHKDKACILRTSDRLAIPIVE